MSCELRTLASKFVDSASHVAATALASLGWAVVRTKRAVLLQPASTGKVRDVACGRRWNLAVDLR